MSELRQELSCLLSSDESVGVSNSLSSLESLLEEQLILTDALILGLASEAKLAGSIV